MAADPFASIASSIPGLSGMDPSMMENAQQIWTMLDELARSDPSAYRKFIKQQMKHSVEASKEEELLPSICLHGVIQLHGHDDDDDDDVLHVYVNLCSCIRIPSPKDDVEPIPLQCGIVRRETDVETEMEMMVVDIAMHPSVLDLCKHDASHKRAIVEMVTACVAEVADIKLRDDILSHHDMDYMGNKDMLKCFWNMIKDAKEVKAKKNKKVSPKEGTSIETDKVNNKTVMEELTSVAVNATTIPSASGDDTENSKVGLIEMNSKVQKKKALITEVIGPAVPKYTLTMDKGTMIVRVELPLLASIGPVCLDITSADLSLTFSGEEYAPLVVHFNELVDDESAAAKFVKKSHILTVTLPLISPV